jgi:predicted O-methyltransferase YrrM
VADPEQQDAETEMMRTFNRKLHEDNRVTLAMATMGDGLTLACKVAR